MHLIDNFDTKTESFISGMTRFQTNLVFSHLNDQKFSETKSILFFQLGLALGFVLFALLILLNCILTYKNRVSGVDLARIKRLEKLRKRSKRQSLNSNESFKSNLVVYSS